MKTGTDQDASQVQVGSTTPTTITSLISLTAPHPLPPTHRITGVETTVWVVQATLTDYKHETDSDYHLVLQDDAGHTMIAEIPSPNCVGPGSPFASQITNARSEFDAQLHATSNFQTANIPVQVTGVGFFDFNHSQRGVAPNAIEIHPVLDIIFNPSVAASPTPAASPSVSPGPSTQLLADPSFEDGSSAWTATSGVIESSDRVPPHSGTHKAWLGGYGTVHTDTLSQTVTIPATATQVTLSLWLLIATDETGTSPYDKLQIQVRTASDGILATLASYSNLDANQGYEQKSVDLTTFKGETVQLYLRATEDRAKVTSFVVDDVVLTASP